MVLLDKVDIRIAKLEVITVARAMLEKVLTQFLFRVIMTLVA